MQKKKVHECIITDGEYLDKENGRKISLEYYLLLNEEHGTYGVEIQKYESDVNGNNYKEINSVNEYSADINDAENLLEKLSKNTVTPICLNEILEDI